MDYIVGIKKCLLITSRYASAAYFGYRVGTSVESFIEKKKKKRPQKFQPHPSHFSNPNSKWTRWKKKLNDKKWVKNCFKPGVLGAVAGMSSLYFTDNLIIPLIQAYRAKSFLEECFDEKLLEKFNVKPLSLRIKEDDWPINVARLPQEMELEEKAQICGLWHEDVSTLDPTARQIRFILSCILFLSDLDQQQYDSLLDHLLRLLRAGKLSPRLRKYILMLLLRRGYKIPKYLYLMLKA